MNIVHFSDSYHPQMNGVTVAVEQYAEEMAKENNVLLIVPSYSLRNSITTTGNLTIRRVHSIPFPIYPGTQAALINIFKLYRTLKQFKPDIIHIHTPFVLGFIGLMFSQVMNVKLVNTYHTLFSQTGSVYLSPKRLIPGKKIKSDSSEQGLLAQIIWRLQVMFFNQSDAVIAPTKVIEKKLKKQGIKKPIKVIASGLHLQDFPVKSSFKPTNRILHLGRLAFEKDPEVILKAFALVHQEIPSATLVIAGDGPARKCLKDTAKKLNVTKSVTFTGWIGREKVSELYRSCDVFATASTFETQGIVIVEALMSGLPVVAAAVNAPVDLIKNGRNGFLFPEGDEHLCAQHLIALLKDPKRLERMGKTARKYGEGFDSKKLTADLLKYYKTLLKPGLIQWS